MLLLLLLLQLLLKLLLLQQLLLRWHIVCMPPTFQLSTYMT